ncbi:hypothetical protein XFHB_05950 [Xylella fastidiosa]|uniref:Phage-related protein n=1 Tax=Xylella fastidiosa TaxID=2371 RepID=A0ABC8ADI5_XYLFS|nr:hypothetical protein [Xylella fastidiosa]ALR06453.1 hypothetical protein XFHB_05950 [Xylella fastidiosa]
MTMTLKEDKTEIIDEQRIQIAKLISETAKIQAEIHEINAQTKKLTAESKWYPVVVGSSLIAAGATAATLFIKLFH